jgi:uncharacterized repeat protein (TIGR01451 family)
MPGRGGLALTLIVLAATTLALGQAPQASKPPAPPQLDGPPLPPVMTAPKASGSPSGSPSVEERQEPVLALPPQEPASVAPKSESPIVLIETVAPKSINAGRPLLTELLLKNVGGAPAYQIKVEAELPPKVESVATEPKSELHGSRLLFSPLESLNPGEERRLRIQFKTADEGDVSTKATVTFSSAVTQTTRITRPKLILKKSGPETAAVGESITFRLEVANAGTGPAEGIVLRDILPPGLQHPHGPEIEADVGTLGPGESKTIELSVKAAATGKQVNQVIATAEDDLKVTDQATVTVGQAMVKLAKRGPARVFINTEAVFTLELSNPGDAAARNVELLDALPAGVTFAGASDGGRYDRDSHSVQWRFDALKPGETRQVLVKVLAGKAGEWKNQAVVRAEPNLSETAQIAVVVVGVPAILLEVVDLDDPLEVGAETAYEIRVLNQGTAANTNLQVLVLIPDGLTPTRAQSDVPHKIQGQQVIFEPLPKLAPKADMVYRVYARGDTPGDHRVKVQLQSDQLRIPVTEEESTRVYRD